MLLREASRGATPLSHLLMSWSFNALVWLLTPLFPKWHSTCQRKWATLLKQSLAGPWMHVLRQSRVLSDVSHIFYAVVYSDLVVASCLAPTSWRSVYSRCGDFWQKSSRSRWRQLRGKHDGFGWRALRDGCRRHPRVWFCRARNEFYDLPDEASIWVPSTLGASPLSNPVTSSVSLPTKRPLSLEQEDVNPQWVLSCRHGA